MPHYSAFQLNIASDLEFPELLPGYPLADIDCHIRIDHSIKELEAPSKKAVTYQVARGQFWLSIPNIGRFLVKNGQTISIAPHELIDEATLRLFILGPCLSALLLQQGKYILNGDVFTIDKHAYAIVGHGGVGKSVLTQACLTPHRSLLSSGLCVIDASGNALPGYPRIQLWSDAVSFLSLEKPEQRIRPSLNKWSIPADHRFCNTALPLRAIYLLRTHNKPEITLEPLKGFEKFNHLRSHTAHEHAIEHLLDYRQYQLKGTLISNRAYIAKIYRPDARNTVNALIEKIMFDLENQGFKDEHS